MEFTNIPDSLLFLSATKDHIDVKLRANGFMFLRFKLAEKKIGVDLSSVKRIGTNYYIAPYIYRKKIERQLQKSGTIVEMDMDTVFFSFDTIYSKTIFVDPKVKIDLALNFVLEGELKIEPRTIRVTGPKREIDSIKSIRTQEKKLSNLSSNFVERLRLIKPKTLKNTVFSKEYVVVSGKISRFSEKIIKIPVETINVPEGMEIKTFPHEIPVLCKAKLEDLKGLDVSDFKIVADYNSKNKRSGLSVELIDKPKTLLDAQLMEVRVSYILKIKQ